jgi:hypothetical protein
MAVADTADHRRALVMLSCTQEISQGHSPQPWPNQGGELQFSFEWPAENAHFRHRVSFVNKPWADNFAEFASRYPDQRFVVAYSGESAASPQEAESEAMEDAVTTLYPLVRSHLGYHKRQSKWPAVPEQLRQAIAVEMQHDRVVVDRFVQSFRRPYGEIWREAILLDTSPGTMGHLANNCWDIVPSGRAVWMRTTLSIAGLAALITIVYLFLNAATRGYYVWALRIGAVVIVAVGILIAIGRASAAF